MKTLFELGRIVATHGALDAMEYAEVLPQTLLGRHISGDWGDLSVNDRTENELSIDKGFRVLSSYKLHTGATIWIITEADRSATTFLLPEEY